MDRERWRRVRDEALDFVLGSVCAGCAEPGVELCAACAVALRPDPVRRRLDDGTPIVAALRFEGIPARVVRAMKDGRTALLRPLVPALTAAVSLAADADRIDAAVPIPTSRAAFLRRGVRIPELVAGRTGLAVLRPLAVARRVADQRGLSAAERRRNAAGSIRARRRGEGRAVLLVDDVATTGATLSEGVRALRGAGFLVPGCVVLAGTPAPSRHRADTQDFH